MNLNSRPILIYGHNERFKFIYGKIHFCLIAFFTTWNYIFYDISFRIIHSIYPIINIVKSKSVSDFYYLIRRTSTIITIFLGEILNIIFTKRKFQSPVTGTKFYSPIKYGKCRVISFEIIMSKLVSDFVSTFSTRASKSSPQISGECFDCVSTITFTNPLCSSPFIIRSCIFNNCQPSKSHSHQIHKFSHFFTSLIDNLQMLLVLLSRQHLHRHLETVTKYNTSRSCCLDMNIISWRAI